MKKLICMIAVLSMFFCIDVYPGNPSDISSNTAYADLLSTLGFLNGTGNGLELDRAVTRAEAVTMVVRITGKEPDAMLSSARSGFHDTDLHWSFAYVGYGARNGIVNGTSATTFEPDRTVTGQEFVKMMLLAMEYKDITLENAYEQGVDILLLNSDTKAVVKENKSLSRKDAAGICYEALFTKMADGTVLYKELIKRGLFTEEKWNGALKETNLKSTDKYFISALIAQMPDDKNYMFSPFSIKMALAMTANGADGETKTEILNAIGIDDLNAYNADIKDLISKYNKTDIIKLNVANSIWINTDRSNDIVFSDAYKSKMTNFYNAESNLVNNNNAVDIINEWVNEKPTEKYRQ